MSFVRSNSGRRSHRRYLASLIGNSGERIFEVAKDIMEGKPYIPQLPDGTFGQPQVPRAQDRLHAAQFLKESLLGKAVAETEVIQAEAVANEALLLAEKSDEELQAIINGEFTVEKEPESLPEGDADEGLPDE